jgi:putative nucleotidyltransferase with HDIG domain
VREAYEQTLEAWAKALEYRDRDTEGHSRRVTELSTRLALEVGCTDADLERIRWGALLHDIGKLAIPDRVLLKPGPLTVQEMELMRRHPTYAREMLSGIPFLRSAMAIPCHHHEQWNGEGYPQGLKGEEIPLAARIFTVVDQWEALTSDRPYRKAWSQERVLAHMRHNAGTIFDPNILRVFLERIVPGLDGGPPLDRP